MFPPGNQQPIAGRPADSHMLPGEDLEGREIRLFKRQRHEKSMSLGERYCAPQSNRGASWESGEFLQEQAWPLSQGYSSLVARLPRMGEALGFIARYCGTHL